MALQLTNEFKQQVVHALLQARANYDGTEQNFADQWDINNAVWSTIKNNVDKPEILAGKINNAKWLSMAYELGVSNKTRSWNIARTDVFNAIEEDSMFCKTHAKAMIFIGDPEIGKSETAKYLARNTKNTFLVDASQAKTKQAFIRLLAKSIGVDSKGKYLQVKAAIKQALIILPQPLVIVDEFGDLEYTAFLELKELWNATQGACGWYMMGADGARAKMERGIDNKKVGYAEIFSRFSSSYGNIIPPGKADRTAFYKKLITDVLSVNMKNKSKLGKIVNQCLTDEYGSMIGGLRRAETFLILNQEIE